DIADEGSFSAGGRGMRAAQKVRLLHAAIRRMTREHTGWDMADGLPLNQEDLAATLMTFSVIVLDSVDRLDVPASAEEREAWLHLWKVIGALLGIRSELLPRDVADGDALMESIRRRQWVRSPQ